MIFFDQLLKTKTRGLGGGSQRAGPKGALGSEPTSGKVGTRFQGAFHFGLFVNLRMNLQCTLMYLGVS